ncbi:MAG: MATE family efflux transporter [Pseudomonadota bacterium]
MSGPVFLRGSTMKHVLVMTSTSSVGLLALFAVDVFDIYFINLLGDQRLVAAVGFAGSLQFFLLSLGIGLQIALGALVARAEGSGDRDRAGRLCSSVLVFNGITSSVLAALTLWQLPTLLSLLGAEGATKEYAISYARIVLPAVPLLVLGMSMSAGMRAVGDARRSMYATLSGALANAGLDPLFIFTFEWGIEGAAWASVAARIVVFAYAASVLFRIHKLPAPVTGAKVLEDIPEVLSIGLPAVLTNLATPIGGSIVLRIMSEHGDGAVAASSILARILPLSFAAVFAVSGAVGPIVGQNAGACHYERVRQTLLNASMFVIVYVLSVWVVLNIALDGIVALFATSALAEDLLRFYIRFLVGFFALNGLLFVANASFNNLGRAYFATLFNYAKVLLGVIPGAYLGSQYLNARGALLGESIGMAIFGVAGMLTALALVKRLQRDYPPLEPVKAES